MAIVTALLSLLLVVGIPAGACIFWARRLEVTRDSSDLVAVAFGGLGVAAIALWVGASLLGQSVWVSLLAPIVGAGILYAAGRAGASGRSGAGEGRMVAGAAVAATPSDERVPSRTQGGERAASTTRRLAVIALLFVVMVLIPFAPFGYERGGQVHRLAMTDWYKHLVVATALVNTDAFPPANPFLHTVENAPYYYGFHLVATAMARLAGDGDVFVMLLLLTIATAAALPFVVFAFARRLCNDSQALWAAGMATFLAGFDLVPVTLDVLRNIATNRPLPGGFAGVRAIIPAPHVDYWVHHNERQLNAFYITTSWAPQHVAAVLTSLLVIWLVAEPLWRQAGASPAAREADRDVGSQRLAGLVLPALLIASLPAVSAYVAVGTGFGVVAMVCAELLRNRGSGFVLAVRWGAVGVAGAVIALPVLRVLSASNAPGLMLRISSAGSWKNGALFGALFGDHQWTRLLDTPAFVFFELGIVGLLAASEVARRRRRDGFSLPERQVIVAALAILVLITFVRPPEGPNNLFARPMVLVFALLTPFAAMAATRIGRSAAMRGAVVLCALATGYSVAGNLVEAMFWAAPAGQVEGMRWINANLPRGTLVAVAPVDYERSFGYWLRRPMLMADERHALLLGASPEEFDRAAANTSAAFGAASAAEAAALFEELEVGAIFLPRTAFGAAGVPSWAHGGCFEVGSDSETWILLRLVPGGC